MKVCSLYGAGFYYIPGTDICLKVGGYVRYQVNVGSGNSVTGGPFFGAGNGGFNSRTVTNDVLQRSRAIATFDSRQQTAYGTLRTYLLMGFSQETSSGTTTAPSVYNTRAFIQIAGFTFGKATSFFDFVSSAAVAYNAGFTSSPDTGDGGQIVGAYTAQFGNGLSGTIAIEQSRRIATAYGSAGNGAFNFAGVAEADLGATPGALAAATSGASRPDIVANLRIDQAWGSAQIAGAVHDVSASYYGTGVVGTAAAPVFVDSNGHPGNKWGWAISPGLRLNAPMFGPGDYFQASVTYAQGASRFASNTPGGGNLYMFSGNTVGFGFGTDGVFGGTAAGGANDIELTTSFSAFASYEHFWTPSLRTSLYGSIYRVDYNSTATSLICSTGSVAAGAANFAATCNPDFTYWNIGSRSQWNVTKDFYVGVDVIYTKLESGQFNNTGTAVPLTLAGTTGKTSGLYTSKDQDAVSVTWRAHRDIVP